MSENEKRALRIGVELGRLREVRLAELGVRFAFGAAISLAVALVGMRFGHRAAGLFLSFPAILPASLTLIEDKHGSHPAKVNAIGAVLGGAALAVFAAGALLLLPRAPLAITLAACVAAWLVAAGLLYFAAAYLLIRLGRRPEAPDRPGSLRRRQAG